MILNNISMNNTKLANIIKKYDDLIGWRNIITTSARGAKIKKEIQFVINRNLSQFDMAVADAVYSLEMQGIHRITARKILVAMSGDEFISVPKERKLQIEETVDGLIATEIHISCKEEKSDTILPRYGGRFIDAVKEGNGYLLQGETPMPLYAYGEAKRQMITVPWELLNYRSVEGKEKSDRIINSNENILLKFYLIQQLEIIKNKRNTEKDKTFRFKNRKEIFKILEIDDESFTEESLMNKIRDIYRRAELLFDYWKRIGYIKDYETNKKEYSIYVSQEMICENIFKTIKMKSDCK